MQGIPAIIYAQLTSAGAHIQLTIYMKKNFRYQAPDRPDVIHHRPVRYLQ